MTLTFMNTFKQFLKEKRMNVDVILCVMTLNGSNFVFSKGKVAMLTKAKALQRKDIYQTNI